ncbi:mecr [Symbiodinium sp. CCMP2592]|nr:mecr [Symbiodinium sp. CCMP2592]
MVAPGIAGVNRNLYEVLGVARDASLSAIRAAYRKLAVQLHPDKGGGREEFAELQAAYVILCNVALRQRYDETGKTDVPADIRNGQRARTEQTPVKEEVLTCWKCGSELPANAKFCQECGAPRQAPAAKQEAQSRKNLQKVQLPPALQALVEGRTLESVPVAEDFEQTVAHITVTEKEGKRTLKLVWDPEFGLWMSDLNAENRYGCGDIYGCQGIGQIRMVGPRVTNLKPGDWVLPLHDVDADGDIDLDAAPPGTGRVLGVWKESRCAKLEFSADSPLSIANMALAKSIGAACLLVEEHASKLSAGETVILNCANGSLVAVLIQLLTAKGFTVLAVVRKHSGEEWIKQKLEGLGAKRVFLMQDNVREILEDAGQQLPALALDGVGGAATNQLVQALTKTGDLVCFGVAAGGGQQAVPLNTGKKWKGNMLQFSFDEWLNRDVTTNAKILNRMLLEVTQLVNEKKMQFVIKEYTTQRFNMAVLNAKQIGRTHCVVLHLPRLEEVTRRYTDDALVLQETSLQDDKQHRRSWDLDFLEWEDGGAEEEYNWRVDKEKSLFKLHPDAADGAIERYSDDTSPTPIAQELGASPAKAEAVLFWLPGTTCRLESESKSDNEAVQLGLRFGVVDDELGNPLGQLSRSKGAASFEMPLLPSEIDALRQVECAALALKRRAQLEEEQLKRTSSNSLPFFFGGFGQGGVVALYAATCLMEKPIDAVAFCHSGVPAASMIGKRLTPQVRRATRLHAIYDKADEEIPTTFPDTIHQMLSLAQCKASLYWLQKGDGHAFQDEAAGAVIKCAHMWLEELRSRPDVFRSFR